MKKGHTDTRAAAARRKRARIAAKRDAAYLAWLHTLPCAVCRLHGIEVHHFPYRSKAGWHDRLSLPLCPEHHRGKAGFHTLGRAKWERLHGVDTAARIAALNAEYGA